MQKLSLSRFVVPGIAGIVGAMAADFVVAPLIRANVPGWGGLTGEFWWRLPFAILFGFAAGRLVRRGDWWNIRLPRKGPKLSEWATIAGIILVTAAVLFPVFAQTRFYSGPGCLGNAKQLGLATLIYAEDYDGRLFPVSYRRGGERAYWFGAGSLNGDSYRCTDGLLFPYLKNERVFDCPLVRHDELPTYSPTGDPAKGRLPAYGLNDLLYAPPSGSPFASVPPLLTPMEFPSETILFAESAMQERNAPGGLARSPVATCYGDARGRTIHARHDGKAFIVWADGHANAMPVTISPNSEEKRLGDIIPDDQRGWTTPEYYSLLRKPRGDGQSIEY